MEPRNYESDAIATPPDAPVAPSNGYPTDGNPQTGQSATLPGAHWFYKVGESLRKIITDAGLTPNDADLGQLKTALVSPQTDVDAGTDDNRFVTPKKLRWGFAISLTGNGYIVFPSWLGSLILQWGGVSASAEQATATLPITFPNAVLRRFLTMQDKNSGVTAGLTLYANDAINTTSQIGGRLTGYDSGTWVAHYFVIGH